MSATSYDIGRLAAGARPARRAAPRDLLRPESARSGAGRPQARPRWRSGAAGRAASSSRRADRRRHGRCSVGPIPAAASCSCWACSSSGPWRSSRARRTGRSSARDWLLAAPSPRPRSRPRRPAGAARSTTGPASSSWPRPSTAIDSSRRPTRSRPRQLDPDRRHPRPPARARRGGRGDPARPARERASQYVILARGIDPTTRPIGSARRRATAGVTGISLESEPERVYPQAGGGPDSTLAAHLLGLRQPREPGPVRRRAVLPGDPRRLAAGASSPQRDFNGRIRCRDRGDRRRPGCPARTCA